MQTAKLQTLFLLWICGLCDNFCKDGSDEQMKILSIILTLLLFGCSISTVSTDYYDNPQNWGTYTYPSIGCQVKHPPAYMKYDSEFWTVSLMNGYMLGVVRAVRLQRVDDKLELMIQRIQNEDFSPLPARIRNDPESLSDIGYGNESIISRETFQTKTGLKGLKVAYHIYPAEEGIAPENYLPIQEEMTKIFAYFVSENEIFELIFTGESHFVDELAPEIDAIIKNFSVIPVFSEEEAGE